MDCEDDGAEFVADLAAAYWRDTTRVLSPLIGGYGLACFYRHALQLAVPGHPWLTDAAELSYPLTFNNLRQTLALQPAEKAIAAFNALISAFNEVVASLVGPVLTQMLLSSGPLQVACSPVHQDSGVRL